MRVFIWLKSGACYITGQWVWEIKLKKSNPNSNPSTNYLLLLFIIQFMSFSWFLRLYHFYGLLATYLLYEEIMSVRLYDFVYRDVFILVYICWFFTKNIIILVLYIFYKHHSNSTSGRYELQFIFYFTSHNHHDTKTSC